MLSGESWWLFEEEMEQAHIHDGIPQFQGYGSSHDE